MVDDVPVFVFLLLLIARNDLRPAHTKGAGVVTTVHRILYSDQVTYFLFPDEFLSRYSLVLGIASGPAY